MNRRSILIVLGALAAVAVILAAWFWLFSQGSTLLSGFGSGGNKSATSTATVGSKTNSPYQGLGAGSTATQTSGGGAPITNPYAGGATNVPIGGGASGGVEATAAGTVGTAGGVESINGEGNLGTGTVVPVDPGGVSWLGGTGAGGFSGAQTTTFVPSSVNQLNDGTTGGQVTINPTGQVSGQTSNGQYAALFAVVGAGTLLCTAGLLGTGTAGAFTGGGSTAAATALDVAAVPVRATGVVTQVGVTNAIASSQSYKNTFLDCIARSVGRAIVDQITSSVVNWINGGFRGSPSFVQNYQQFFTNVADQAAGNYIRGSALAFLCSPFQLQIKIAIAQSYANRNQGAACTLSGVVNNVNNFLKGNFSSGGWPGLLTFTTMPANNPFGAYAYGQIGLATAQQNALNNANRNITPGGFISFSQAYDCQASVSQSGSVGQNGQLTNNSSLFLTAPQSAAQQCPSNCKCKTATPGSVIEASLIGTQNSTLTQLNLAKNFDEIISALITQLMTRTLQQGLSNLSGAGGYQANFLTPEQQQAQSGGNALLAQLQAAVAVSQQYGQVEQGSAADLQNAQNQLATLLNCWEAAGRSAQATTTASAITALEVQVAVHNNNITRANQSIAALQQLQTEVLGIASSLDLARAAQNVQAAISSGVIITQDDTTQAQQNRTTLQSQLAARNQQTATELAQCRATATATSTTP